jgi:long-chain acyl-CoA synthetase
MPIPRSAAVIAPDGSLDSSALQHATDQLTSALARAGVESGTTVALMLPNSVAFVPTYLALRSLSATVALIPPKYGPAELEAIRQGAGPACFVTTASGARAIDGGRVVPLALTIGAEPLVVSFCGERGSPRDAAVLKFTSGSTGQPKGIALTAAALEGEAANIVGGLSLGPGDRVFAPVPLSHSYGFDLGVLAMLRSGCTLALEDTFVPRRLLAELASGRVTVFLGVPAMYRAWLAMPPTGAAAPLPVRYLLSCTAPLPAAVVTAFHGRYHSPICQHYGSSETGAVTTHVPDEVLERPDSVGRPMGDVKLKTVDGEVVVTSGALARGYVMGAPLDRQPFQPDGYHTGDRGRLEDGFLYIDGRTDDLINVGGFKVSPREVIDALESFPAVAEAAVVGVHDSRGEEVVYAVVALARPATEAEILAHCRTRLAEYKVPRRVEIRTTLPRGPTGKVQLRAEDVRV